MADQPHIYQYSPLMKGVWSSAFAGLATLGVVGIVMAAAWVPHAPWMMQIGGAGLALLGLYGLASVFRYRLVLYADRFEYHGVFTSRTVRFDEIVRTFHPVQQYGHFNISLRLSNGRSVRISDFGRMDAVLEDWLNSLPNEEVAEANAKRERLLANPTFGATPEVRERAIAVHGRMIWVVNMIAFGLCGWAWFRPTPYASCMYALMVAPMVAIVLCALSCRRWEVMGGGPSDRLDISGLAVFPSMLLFLRAILDIQLESWLPTLAGAMVAGGAALALCIVADGRFRPTPTMLAAVVCLIYGWGGSVLLNDLLDQARPKIFHVDVLDKHESSGKATSYGLTLTAWGMHPSGEDASVSSDLYQQVKAGDHVCVYLYPGRFGWPYYDADTCPKS